MRLGEFILANLDPIMQEWEDFARTIAPVDSRMDTLALRNDAVEMLRTIAADLATAQSSRQQFEKSKGQAPHNALETAARTHASARLLSGFTIRQLVAEFRALRASVLKQWSESADVFALTDAQDITRFNEAIDQTLGEAVDRFSNMATHSQNLFLAILGHDLRNPLGTTLTASRFLMAAPELTDQSTRAATRIYSSGKRMAKLVDDLIDFSRSYLGPGLPLSPREIDIGEVAFATVEEMRILHHDRAIEFQVDGKLHGYWDESRIAQVFSNLIANAVQYGSKTAPIRIQVREEDSFAVAEINNRGDLITAKQMLSIFDPLIRFAELAGMDYSRTTNLGIGLYIAKEVVTAHGGTITVTSTEEDGTTFCVRLPKDGKA